MWYDLDTFLLDQVSEVLDKLDEGSLDDAIWGKIVVMEKCKRVAKAYLRKTTIIVDGSEDEFDGSTLGFNAFDNTYRDEYTDEIRQKIQDGVILKVDYQGNIKGMSRGMAPVICLGFKDSERRKNCISDRLARLQGRLNTSEEDKAFKLFDMKRFKSALDREISDGQPDARNLLLKTAIRVALVKDGGDMNRTPCWFTVINLIALDTLKSRIPNIKNMAATNRESAYSSLPTLVAPTPLPFSQSNNNGQESIYGLNSNGNSGDATQALTQLIAAAVKQASTGQTVSQSMHNLPVSVDQLATLATSLSMGKPETQPGQILAPQVGIKGDRKDRRRNYKVPSADDSSGEDSALRSDSTQGDVQPRSRAKRWDQTTKSIDAIVQQTASMVPTRSRSPDVCGDVAPKRRGPPRPRLQDVMFDRSYSTTSDYDSNRELFDSGSWSSNGSNCYQGRSPSSSVVSDSEGHGRVARGPKLEAQEKPQPKPQHPVTNETPLARQHVIRKELHSESSNHSQEARPRAEIYDPERREVENGTLDHLGGSERKPRLTFRMASGGQAQSPPTKPPPPPNYDDPEDLVSEQLWEKQRPASGSQRAASFVGELRRVLLKRNSFKEKEPNNNTKEQPSLFRKTSKPKSGLPPIGDPSKSQPGKRPGRPPIPPSHREESRQEPYTLPMSRPATAVPPAANRYEDVSPERGTLSYGDERKRNGLRRTHAINSAQSARSASSISHHVGAPFTEQYSGSAMGHYR
ncbi:unnamed protein product, partial [Mesorhabditis spiculigera]